MSIKPLISAEVLDEPLVGCQLAFSSVICLAYLAIVSSVFADIVAWRRISGDHADLIESDNSEDDSRQAEKSSTTRHHAMASLACRNMAIYIILLSRQRDQGPA